MSSAKSKSNVVRETLIERVGIAAVLVFGIYLIFEDSINLRWSIYQSKPFRGNCATQLTQNFETEIRRFPGGWNNIRGLGISRFIRDYCNCVSDDLIKLDFPFADFNERNWKQKQGETFTAFAGWSRTIEGRTSMQRCAIRAEEAGRKLDPQLGKVMVLDKKRKN
jgi:hypothetical protein